MARLKRLKNIRLHREGTHTLIGGLIAFVVLNTVVFYSFQSMVPFYIVGTISIIIYCILVNFFRCPIRMFGKDTAGVVVAPADGKVVAIEEVEENEYFHERRLQVSIFMSLWNVHANWFPVDGTVKKVWHQNGRYMAAWLPKSSTDNERASVVIEMPSGIEIMATQIAGAVARRIVTYAKEGDDCYIDEHLGFIKFGSRVDLFLPVGTKVEVTMGQHTTGNETIIAHL